MPLALRVTSSHWGASQEFLQACEDVSWSYHPSQLLDVRHSALIVAHQDSEARARIEQEIARFDTEAGAAQEFELGCATQSSQSTWGKGVWSEPNATSHLMPLLARPGSVCVDPWRS